MIIEGGVLENINDVIIIQFDKPFTDVKKIIDFNDVTSNETLTKFFTKEFRYSHDNTEWSSWNSLSSITLQLIQLSNPLYIEVRYIREGTDNTGTIEITEFDFEIEYLVKDKFQNQTCKTSCGTCDDFIGNCEENLLNPYQLQTINCVQQAINDSVSNVYGHCVKYWRALPENESSDVIFKEYSLRTHEASRALKIIIPNNELPDNQIQFTQYEMDFFDLPFEIHIVKSSWEAVYGINTMPSQKDTIYIEILDRLYQVNSVYLYKPMGTGTGTYYKLMLVKWQDDSNIYATDDVRQELDELIESFEDVFEEEYADELLQKSKPQQFEPQTTTYDNIRETVATNLKIIDFSLENNWTVISKNYYDLKTIALGSDAVIYNEKSKINESMSFTCWLNLNTTYNSLTNAYLIYGSNGSLGIQIYYNQTGLNVWVNNVEYNFNLTLTAGIWYGVVVNLSTVYKEIQVAIYTIPANNQFINTESQSLKLVETYNLFLNNLNINKFELQDKFKVIANDFKLTNIRIFDKLIPDEEKSKILNQYIVKDNQHALIIDNSKKQLDLIHRNPHK